LLKEYEDMMRAEGEELDIENIKEADPFEDDPDMREI
jgi:hypothetical protein